MIDAVIERVCRVIEGLIASALAVMVVLVFGNVVLRYAFNSGIAISEEVSRWLFVWLCFLGALLALKDGDHLGSDMLVSRLPIAGKKACMAAGHLLMLYVTWLFLQGSWQQMRLNHDVAAPVTGAPMSLFYASGVAFSACAGLLLLLQLIRLLTGRLAEQELVRVRESEEQAELDTLRATWTPPQGQPVSGPSSSGARS